MDVKGREVSLLDSLPNLAVAKRRQRTKDSLGGPIDSFTEVVFQDRSCWRQPASDREINQWQHRDVDITHKVYFGEDPEVDENCILIIDGVTMLVKSVSTPDASIGLGLLWRVMVEEI